MSGGGGRALPVRRGCCGGRFGGRDGKGYRLIGSLSHPAGALCVVLSSLPQYTSHKARLPKFGVIIRHLRRYLAIVSSGESFERGMAGLEGGNMPPDTTPVSSSTMPETLLGMGWDEVLNFSPAWGPLISWA